MPWAAAGRSPRLRPLDVRASLRRRPSRPICFFCAYIVLRRTERLIIYVDFWTDPNLIDRFRAEMNQFRKTNPESFGETFNINIDTVPDVGTKVKLVRAPLQPSAPETASVWFCHKP